MQWKIDRNSSLKTKYAEFLPAKYIELMMAVFFPADNLLCFICCLNDEISLPKNMALKCNMQVWQTLSLASKMELNTYAQHFENIDAIEKWCPTKYYLYNMYFMWLKSAKKEREWHKRWPTKIWPNWLKTYWADCEHFISFMCPTVHTLKVSDSNKLSEVFFNPWFHQQQPTCKLMAKMFTT